MLGNVGEMRGKKGEGSERAGNGRDAEGTYGGGALGTGKATNTRTRALRGARRQPKSDTTPRGVTRHGTRIPITVHRVYQRRVSVCLKRSVHQEACVRSVYCAIGLAQRPSRPDITSVSVRPLTAASGTRGSAARRSRSRSKECGARTADGVDRA
jgi:hypothetical protein